MHLCLCSYSCYTCLVRSWLVSVKLANLTEIREKDIFVRILLVKCVACCGLVSVNPLQNIYFAWLFDMSKLIIIFPSTKEPKNKTLRKKCKWAKRLSKFCYIFKYFFIILHVLRCTPFFLNLIQLLDPKLRVFIPGRQFASHGQMDDTSGLVIRIFAYECLRTIFSLSHPHLPHGDLRWITSLLLYIPVFKNLHSEYYSKYKSMYVCASSLKRLDEFG